MEPTFELLTESVVSGNKKLQLHFLEQCKSNIEDLLQYTTSKDYYLTTEFILKNIKPSTAIVKKCVEVENDNNKYHSVTLQVLKNYLNSNQESAANIVVGPVVKRPLVVLDRIVDMIPGKSNSAKPSKNSVLMVTLSTHPDKAHQELLSGVISNEELNHKNESGWTVLHYLARNTRVIPNGEKILQTLLELGADINIQNNFGYTALIYASKWSISDSTENVVKMLLARADVNVNLKLASAEDALYVACESIPLSIETIKMLLKHPKIEVKHPSILSKLLQLKSDKNYLDLIVEILMHPTNVRGITLTHESLKKMSATEVTSLLSSSDFAISN